MSDVFVATPERVVRDALLTCGSEEVVQLMSDVFAATPERVVRDALLTGGSAAGLGGIPVEHEGATVPPPDQRRSCN